MIRKIGTLRDIASDVEDFLEETDETLSDVSGNLEKVLYFLEGCDLEGSDEAKSFLEDAINGVDSLINDL